MLQEVLTKPAIATGAAGFIWRLLFLIALIAIGAVIMGATPGEIWHAVVTG